MGLNFYKSIKLGKHLKMNIGSKGVSFTTKVGPVSINSKGKKTINLGNGLKYTKYKKGK